MKTNKIKDPKIGTIVKHTGWGFESDKNYPCDVFIIDGAFTQNGRVSNFWYWQRINSDGSLAETECGYGSFEKSDKNYKIKTIIECID